MIFIVDEIAGGRFHVFLGQVIDALIHLGGGQDAAVSQQLPADVSLGVDASLQVGLGDLNFFVGDVVTETHQVISQGPHGVIQLVVWASELHTEQTSILKQQY